VWRDDVVCFVNLKIKSYNFEAVFLSKGVHREASLGCQY
jgi:hypothetical protein